MQGQEVLTHKWFGATGVSPEQTLNTTLDLLEAVPRQQSCPCKCIAFSVGAPWSTEVSKQVGVSGEPVCSRMGCLMVQI